MVWKMLRVEFSSSLVYVCIGIEFLLLAFSSKYCREHISKFLNTSVIRSAQINQAPLKRHMLIRMPVETESAVI